MARQFLPATAAFWRGSLILVAAVIALAGVAGSLSRADADAACAASAGTAPGDAHPTGISGCATPPANDAAGVAAMLARAPGALRLRIVRAR